MQVFVIKQLMFRPELPLSALLMGIAWSNFLPPRQISVGQFPQVLPQLIFWLSLVVAVVEVDTQVAVVAAESCM